MHIGGGIMDKIIKVKSESQTVKNERAIVHYISTMDKDLGGDIVYPEGVRFDTFKNFNTVFYNHDYNLPIAKNLWLKNDGKGILAKTQFGKTLFADDIYSLHEDGIINTWSVGISFNEKETEWDSETKTFHIKGCDLVEYSSAPLAMNPNALDQVKKVKSVEMKSLIEREMDKIEVQKAIEEFKSEILTFTESVKQIQEEIEFLKSGGYENSQLLSNLEKEVFQLTKLAQKKVETSGDIESRIAGEVSQAIKSILKKKD